MQPESLTVTHKGPGAELSKSVDFVVSRKFNFILPSVLSFARLFVEV